MNPNRKLLQTRDCLLALLHSMTSGPPWSDWLISAAFSSYPINEQTEQAMIYVGAPQVIDQEYYLGGGARYQLGLDIGVWNGPKSGGIDEHIVMLDELYALFSAPDVHTQTFDVELDGTMHSGHSLQAQGIRIDALTGPQRFQQPTNSALHSQWHLTLAI